MTREQVYSDLMNPNENINITNKCCYCWRFPSNDLKKKGYYMFNNLYILFWNIMKIDAFLFIVCSLAVIFCSMGNSFTHDDQSWRNNFINSSILNIMADNFIPFAVLSLLYCMLFRLFSRKIFNIASN